MIADSIRRRSLPHAARTTPRPRITGLNRILILQPDHLGDIILSEPAVRYLRSALPDAELIAAIGPWSAEIASMAWPVDRVIEVDYPGFRRQRAINPIEPYGYLFQFARELRELGADDAVVLRDDAWWAAWLARASVGRHVVAGNDHRVRPFATEAVPISNSDHRTATAWNLVGALASQFDSVFDDQQWDMSPKLLPDSFDQNAEPSDSFPEAREPYIVLHPGSGAPVKLWPVDRWRAVVREFGDTRFVLTGSESESAVCKEIAAGIPSATSVAGRTPLRVLAKLLANAALAVGTDSGPMHLAGAVGTPTVRLFGPSNPERYGPWPGTPEQTVVSAGWSCPRCEDLSITRDPGCGCMVAIETGTVVEEIRTALGREA